MKHYNFCSTKSYLKDEVLNEYFSITHYNEYKPVNRAEQCIIDYIIKLLEQPWTQGIEALRANIQSQAIPNGYGTFRVSIIYVGGSIAGHTNWHERQFEITAGSRTIPSLVINETVFKDHKNEYKMVPSDQLVYNKDVKEI